MTITIKNPVFNGANELISFDGIKLVNNQLDKTDAASMKLVEEIKALPRIKEYTGSASPRVKIDDKEYKLSYKFFSDKEVETYNTYRGKHGSNAKSTNKAVLNERLATLKNLDAVIATMDEKQAAPIIKYRDTIKAQVLADIDSGTLELLKALGVAL
ncbi:MAG: hypothetical protein IKQ22_00760 [Clostridia bacterium]|nr:hypothetical protein [Clostridia bacterium]